MFYNRNRTSRIWHWYYIIEIKGWELAFLTSELGKGNVTTWWVAIHILAWRGASEHALEQTLLGPSRRDLKLCLLRWILLVSLNKMGIFVKLSQNRMGIKIDTSKRDGYRPIAMTRSFFAWIIFWHAKARLSATRNADPDWLYNKKPWSSLGCLLNSESVITHQALVLMDLYMVWEGKWRELDPHCCWFDPDNFSCQMRRKSTYPVFGNSVWSKFHHTRLKKAGCRCWQCAIRSMCLTLKSPWTALPCHPTRLSLTSQQWLHKQQWLPSMAFSQCPS